MFYQTYRRSEDQAVMIPIGPNQFVNEALMRALKLAPYTGDHAK